MEWMGWMAGLIVVGVVLVLVWCFDLIGLLKRRTKGEPKEKNGK